jgi:NADH dehydrogenase [ubiquinone] 1 alpha subcomplex assembly factor 1
MKPSDFDTSLHQSPDRGRRRRSFQRVIGIAGVVLAIASCGSEAPAQSVQVTPAAPPPPTVALTTTAPPETTGKTPANTIVEPPAAATATCQRLTDFDDGDGWVVVNDGVMGGRSNGSIEFIDSTMQFTGDVVTAGGGFTSVRLQLAGNELTGSGSLVLRVRSDERAYGLALQDTAQTGRRSISHGANLIVDGPADGAGWQTVTLSYSELRPSVFGQPLDAPAFDPDQAVEIGIIISDGIDGLFKLEVDWIDACSRQ